MQPNCLHAIEVASSFPVSAEYGLPVNSFKAKACEKVLPLQQLCTNHPMVTA